MTRAAALAKNVAQETILELARHSRTASEFGGRVAASHGLAAGVGARVAALQ